MVNSTLTFCPLTLPGRHFGDAVTILTASSSNRGSTLLVTFTSLTSPDLSITKLTITLPCMPFFTACEGYF